MSFKDIVFYPYTISLPYSMPMKKYASFIAAALLSPVCFAQTIPKDAVPYMDSPQSAALSSTGTIPVSGVFIDNIDLQGHFIPSFRGRNMLELMEEKGKLTVNDVFTGDALIYYYTSPFIYEVDGTLLVTEEDKKMLSAIDIWDTEYFEVLRPREARKRFGRVGKHGAVIIKTGKGNYLNTGQVSVSP